ncbi:MAG: class I mannose-6-phosphate isomerase [Defluviitaleaceae bacterium]|nr:class I mannose-6-phosphate isomerase [Defluviitaleaceae bacterium]
MLYPILFHPIYKEMVWGGGRMADRFGRNLPSNHTGESWDISCRPDDMGIIENGPLAGTPFDKAVEQNPTAFLGTRGYQIYKERGFPLLVKIIDANDDLSIQVHPDDAYAAAHGLESGKSEMWYVMEAPLGQSLIIGLTDDATPEKLRQYPLSCLKRLPIKKGDIIDIPAGLVHAITKGVMIAEIQQNSDITFRLYDYDRLGLDGKPRELHIEDGVAATDFDNIHSGITDGAIVNKHFSVNKIDINGETSGEANPKTFIIFTCVEGSCIVTGGGIQVALPCSRSIFIPAGMGAYTISGNAVLLKSCIV